MGHFFAELKRRHIYQVAAAYTIVAWVLLQLFNNLEPILKLPDWAGSLVLVFLVGGFPLALVVAWTLELNTAPASPDAPTLVAKRPATKVGPHASTASPLAESARKTSGISIAVLPFANMSGDAAQEFFSDGMTEEINAALTKVSDLHVVARTSAFEFKGQNHNISAIGETLGASYLIEGSVRRVGDRVRITAQLIKARDGTHLWAEKYDRNLTDIFVVQEDIAQAIANALCPALGLKQGGALVPSRTPDFESYQQYLHARALVRSRGRAIAQAVPILEPLVARDPLFAPAWALLAQAYALLPAYDPSMRTGAIEEGRSLVRSCFEKSEVAAWRSIQLDSRNGGGYTVLGVMQMQTGNWAEAEDLFRKALALDPSEPDALHYLSLTLASTARFKEALVVGETLLTLEPFVPYYSINVASYMTMNGQTAAAIAMLESIPREAAGGYFRAITLGAAYAAEGRYDAVADALLAMPQPNLVSRESVEDAARLIRTAPAKVSDPNALPDLEGSLNFVYGYIGAEDRMMPFLERVREVTGGRGTTTFMWFPAYAALRKKDSFKAYLRRVGLVDFWRAKGWPERCHPATGDDFECN
jgi:TolB-like protein